MIIEIPDENSVIKWKNNEKDEWKSAEISDLINAYEERPQGELISRDALKAEFDLIVSKSATGEWFSIPIKHIKQIIDNAPTVKPQRPKGKWLKSGKGKTTFFCSECGREIDTKPFTRPDNFPFCHCGANMRGDVK